MRSFRSCGQCRCIAAIAFLLGLGLGASQPSLMSLHPARDPCGAAGEALGVRTMVMNMSHTVLPLLFGGRGHGAGDGAGVLGHGCFAPRHRRVCEAPSRGTVSLLPRKPA